jgi:tetratricopeptide (TPR) repeat protein
VLSQEQLHAQIADPNLCSASYLSDLEALQQTYPYATSFSILYLKTLAKEQDVRLSKALEQHAFKIQNRVVLYDLLVESSVIEEKSRHDGTSHNVSTVPVNEEIQREVLQENTSDELHVEENSLEENPIVEILSNESDLEENAIEEDIVAENLVEANQTDDFETTIETDPLDQLLRASLINSAFVDLTYTEELKSLQEEVDVQKINNNEVQEVVEPSAPLERQTFSQWLHFAEDQAQTDQKEYLRFDKPKQDFYSPAKKAKESLSSDQIPVSETLAKVYAMQGAVTKAIGVYEQLILLNPEKKSFFANQIKVLKKNLNA